MKNAVPRRSSGGSPRTPSSCTRCCGAAFRPWMERSPPPPPFLGGHPSLPFVEQGLLGGAFPPGEKKPPPLPGGRGERLAPPRHSVSTWRSSSVSAGLRRRRSIFAVDTSVLQFP